jgi:pimeloyl-ACP methyl ester carboxylesterase
VGAIVALLAVDLIIRVFALCAILPIFERKPPFGVQDAPPHADGQAVRFATSDGLELAGSVYRHADRPSRGVIVFCPELDGNHWSAMWYCAGLWNAGFDIFAFDFRNQGDSDSLPGYDPLHWLTDYEVADVQSAIDYVQQQSRFDGSRIGLLGISRGGGAALAAAAARPNIQCVVCEGVFSTETLLTHYSLRWAALYVPTWVVDLIPMWHFRQTFALVRFVSERRRRCRYTKLQRLLTRLRGRNVLVIAGARDTYVHPDLSLEIRERIGSESAEFWLVPDAKHNGAREIHPDAYDQKVADFFTHYIEPPAAPEANPVRRFEATHARKS